jgi:hypothetical protein
MQEPSLVRDCPVGHAGQGPSLQILDCRWDVTGFGSASLHGPSAQSLPSRAGLGGRDSLSFATVFATGTDGLALPTNSEAFGTEVARGTSDSEDCTARELEEVLVEEVLGNSL